MASSIAATYQAHKCRQRPNAGIAFCDGGYGEFAAREGVRNVGQAGLVAISLWGRHEGYPEWFAPSAGYAGYNISVAWRQSQIGCPAGEEPVYGSKYNCQPKDSWTEKQLTRMPVLKH
jgi:hypothetical protein